MDPQLLEQLYRKYYRTALLYTLSLCRNEELAKDITADAFVKAYLSLPEDIPSFQYWLLRVCRNLWIDHLRRNSRETDEESLQFLSGGESPENRYLRNERSRYLWKAVDALPVSDRELVVLHYITGLSLQEASQITGLSYSAVRQRMVRIRKTLKNKLEEQGYEYDV